MKTLLIACLAAAAAAGSNPAQEHPEHPKAPPPSTDGRVIEATVSGENVCLACLLKREKGAAAQCDKHGHRHALRVISASAGGKDLPEMEGWVLHYLETDDSRPYIEGKPPGKLTLKGRVYTAERVLEVGPPEKTGKPEHPEHPKGTEHPEHPRK